MGQEYFTHRETPPQRKLPRPSDLDTALVRSVLLVFHARSGAADRARFGERDLTALQWVG
jgi:hypothetical protein